MDLRCEYVIIYPDVIASPQGVAIYKVFMHKYFWLVLIIFILIVGVYFIMNSQKKSASPQGIVLINNQQFNVEIARTDAERQKGLMGRTSLDINAGMLFVFPSSDIQSFWMKNTLIPLDILWINNGKIIEITTLQPETPQNTPTYTPKNKANYVLELPAGTAGKYNFKIDDQVEIKY